MADFQSRVSEWVRECFGESSQANPLERSWRFLEESIELAQSVGCTQTEATELVKYVYGRPKGDPHQEAGGVMVTLAALCAAAGLEMVNAGEVELQRVNGKIDVIRAKNAMKPLHSPLPGSNFICPACGAWAPFAGAFCPCEVER